MNFLTMTYFLTLAEERSFTRAAERLHVTQQTLSGHMAALEREVGMKLFVRHVPLELTDGGAVFLRYAKIFQRNERALRRELSDVSGSESGVLRIGVAPSRGEVLLPDILARFHRLYPRVKLVLREMSNEEICHALKREEIDLGLARFAKTWPGMVERPYREEEIVLFLEESLWQRFGPKEESEAPYEELPEYLADCPFLVNSEADIAGHLARRFFLEAGFEPYVVVESEHMETMLKLCLRGMGACFCPKSLAEALLSEADKQKLHQLAFQGGKYQISFAYMESSHRWSMIENFINVACRGQ